MKSHPIYLNFSTVIIKTNYNFTKTEAIFNNSLYHSNSNHQSSEGEGKWGPDNIYHVRIKSS